MYVRSRIVEWMKPEDQVWLPSDYEHAALAVSVMMGAAATLGVVGSVLGVAIYLVV